MLFNTSHLAFVLLAASNALAAPMQEERSITAGANEVSRAAPVILIATGPTWACRCPNNCSHHEGSSCKYYSGPSDTSHVVEGKCIQSPSGLTCQA